MARTNRLLNRLGVVSLLLSRSLSRPLSTTCSRLMRKMANQPKFAMIRSPRPAGRAGL